MKTNSNKKFVSIVVPALNEQLTIGEFVDWCKEGLHRAGVDGEILIIDSSTDQTAEIAEHHGAKVIKVPKRGLGQAYIDAIPYIKGNYVIVGDCDLTYDFREIKLFIDKMDEGYDLVMGTRMKWSIEKGAMPALHRYFGTPFTTWILNFLIGTKFSDIHCGLRAITLRALKKMDLHSQSWEYASEMVIKAGLMKLKSSEVPISFYKDRVGRQSHHKRSGWFSPWQAGWINLKVMFLYAPRQMIIKPGFLFLCLGLLLILMQVNGPLTIGSITFSASTMMLGLTLSVLGFSSLQMGILVESFSDMSRFHESKIASVLQSFFTYTKGMIFGFGTFMGGACLVVTLIFRWYSLGFKLKVLPWYVVFGMLMVIFGIQTILFSLVYHAFMLNKKER